jgi:molybdopterin synthase catalytic subunit
MAIMLAVKNFDPWQALQSHQNTTNFNGKLGASCIFIGTMRDLNDGKTVTAMTLEHYPGMTEKELEKILAEAHSQWTLLDCLLIHRVGDILPDDTIVLVAVWASHRGDAYDANRHIMEALKSRAPFWKKERLTNHDEAWVIANTDGYSKNVPQS